MKPLDRITISGRITSGADGCNPNVINMTGTVDVVSEGYVKIWPDQEYGTGKLWFFIVDCDIKVIESYNEDL